MPQKSKTRMLFFHIEKFKNHCQEQQVNRKKWLQFQTFLRGPFCQNFSAFYYIRQRKKESANNQIMQRMFEK
jgi:hypothetical protein